MLSTSPLIVRNLAMEMVKDLSFRIALPNDQCIRAPDQRIAGIDAMCPAFERAAWLLQAGKSEARWPHWNGLAIGLATPDCCAATNPRWPQLVGSGSLAASKRTQPAPSS